MLLLAGICRSACIIFTVILSLSYRKMLMAFSFLIYIILGISVGDVLRCEFGQSYICSQHEIHTYTMHESWNLSTKKVVLDGESKQMSYLLSGQILR